MNRWQLQDAKARLSELVKASHAEGPQEITVRGQPAAVVMSKAHYDRMRRRKPGFLDFMRHSPLFGVDLKLDRDK